VTGDVVVLGAIDVSLCQSNADGDDGGDSRSMPSPSGGKVLIVVTLSQMAFDAPQRPTVLTGS
jgi:hypothetical protein